MLLAKADSYTMYKDSLISEIAVLERKVELLLHQQAAVQDKVKQLSEENENLRQAIEEKDKQIDYFQKTIKISKITDYTVADQKEPAELKRTINEYIKKIDKCIAQLSQ